MDTLAGSSAAGRVAGIVAGAATAWAPIDMAARIRSDRINISYRHHSTCQSVAAACGNLRFWRRGGRRRRLGGPDNNRESPVLLLIKCHPEQAHGTDRQHRR